MKASQCLSKMVVFGICLTLVIPYWLDGVIQLGKTLLSSKSREFQMIKLLREVKKVDKNESVNDFD